MSSTKLQIAVVYHSAAAYRESVFRLLFSENELPVEFTLFSGRSSNQSTISLMDPGLASRTVGDGGLRWRLIRNLWIGQFLFQPFVLMLACQKRWDCVVFLGNGYYVSTWLSVLLCRLRGKRVLMWTHGYRVKPQSRWKKIFKNCFYRLADGLILYGQRAKSIMIEEGFRSDRLFVAYNSAPGVPVVATEESAGAKQSVELGPDFKHSLPTVVWVGRMTTEKQLALLVEASQLLHAMGTACNIILVGEGPERSRLLAMVKDRGLEDYFCLPGAIHDTKILATYLRAADVAVSPGAVGLFAILAHGYGLPLVTHDNFSTQGPEAEIISEDQTGTFFTANDASALASALAVWLNQPDKCAAARTICMTKVTDCYRPEVQVRVLTEAAISVCRG